MAGQEDFGQGIAIYKGVEVPCHSWPLVLFKRNFSTLNPQSQEDMKAAVYKWGGPFPSKLERVELQFNPDTVCFELCYWKRSDGILEEQSSDREGQAVS